MGIKKIDNDEDQDSRAADEAAVRSMKEKIADGGEEREPAEDTTEIDVDEAEDELAAKGNLTPEQRESRNDRRRNRYREQQEARTAAERRAEEAERRNQQLMELLQRQQAPQQQPPQAPQKSEEDALQERWNSVAQEQDLLYARARQNQLTPQEQVEFGKKARELQMQMTVIGGEIALRRQGYQKPPDEAQLRATIQAERLHSEHSDVVGDERKRFYADGVWRQMIARGRPNNYETICEAMEQTRRDFGLPTKAKQFPSESYKRKLAGSSRGAGPSGGSESRNVVTMGKAQKKMANAMYAHIPDENKRYQMWAANVGRKVEEQDKTG